MTPVFIRRFFKIQNFCFTSPKVLYSCQSRSNNFFWKTNQWTILIFLKKFNAILKSCQNRKMCTLSRSYKRATKSQVINSSFFTLTGRTILIFLKKFNAILKSCQNRKMCTLSRSYKRATKSQVINSSFFTLTGRPGQYFQSPKVRQPGALHASSVIALTLSFSTQ